MRCRTAQSSAARPAPYYYVGKDPTFGFACTVPFGFNSRQRQAWILQGGGMELMNDFTKDYNTIGFIAGNTGAQMGGWFRLELKSLDDMKGLKFRIAGLQAEIAKLGGAQHRWRRHLSRAGEGHDRRGRWVGR